LDLHFYWYALEISYGNFSFVVKAGNNYNAKNLDID